MIYEIAGEKEGTDSESEIRRGIANF